jgi:hypothetical protein
MSRAACPQAMSSSPGATGFYRLSTPFKGWVLSTAGPAFWFHCSRSSYMCASSTVRGCVGSTGQRYIHTPECCSGSSPFCCISMDLAWRGADGRANRRFQLGGFLALGPPTYYPRWQQPLPLVLPSYLGRSHLVEHHVIVRSMTRPRASIKHGEY